MQAGLQALATAQSALTTFSVLCGLLLLLFVEPATEFFAGGSDLSKDWRPSFMALALLIVYIVILVVPPLRSFFELQLLGVLDYLAIGVLALLWWLIGYCEANLPMPLAWKIVRVVFVVLCVFLLIAILLSLIGHPIVRF